MIILPLIITFRLYIPGTTLEPTRTGIFRFPEVSEVVVKVPATAVVKIIFVVGEVILALIPVTGFPELSLIVKIRVPDAPNAREFSAIKELAPAVTEIGIDPKLPLLPVTAKVKLPVAKESGALIIRETTPLPSLCAIEGMINPLVVVILIAA